MFLCCFFNSGDFLVSFEKKNQKSLFNNYIQIGQKILGQPGFLKYIYREHSIYKRKKH